MSTPLQRLQTGSGRKGRFAETGFGLQTVPRWTAYEQYAGCHYSRNNGVLPLVTSGSCIIAYHKPETYRFRLLFMPMHGTFHPLSGRLCRKPGDRNTLWIERGILHDTFVYRSSRCSHHPIYER